MFQFPGLLSPPRVTLALHANRLPHSDTCGSKVVCTSPQLFAAYRVLRHLWEPRHPPCALSCFLLFGPCRDGTAAVPPRPSAGRPFASPVNYALLFSSRLVNELPPPPLGAAACGHLRGRTAASPLPGCPAGRTTGPAGKNMLAGTDAGRWRISDSNR